ncbi:MAG: hypothetical protein JW751_32245 [Polyangiaceae bacterium]|nr:hypothetical protein [Polyangiaceae bacterium]
MVPLLVVLGGVAIAAAEGDGRAARATLATLSAEPARSALTRREIERAEDALVRAEDARAAGDPEHAARLEALGREWADTGADLARTVAAEERTTAAERRAAELEAKARRARTLLEQTIARRGRAEAQLAALATPSAAPTPSAPTGGTP